MLDSDALAGASFISLTSFKRDGSAVSTPVWCAGEDRALLVFTEANSGKVKRIRHDPHVRVALSSARGRLRGPAVDADAVIVEETARVKELLAGKYGWIWSAYNFLMATTRRIRHQAPPEAVTVKITLR
ncbi:MAG: PPOX class F420-dependent oxidoreductase [Acidobacteriota bacterium]|nr:PPOX class F420-dependent oxidoreductase [Acidobacteriota bacterium]